MGFRSPTCASRSTGKSLMAYRTEVEAQGQARHSKEVYKKDLSSYQCSACQLWHLRPTKPPREAWPECSYCQGRDGNFKISYPSEEDAERQAERISDRTYVRLRAYECRHEYAWHLTSK